ncbi:hypothetical protein PT7_2829 [Pusillimonas sp. T7-7]|nr:hypothetical protein PT7_2829 [Pusillimonas sp. T7-7]
MYGFSERHDRTGVNRLKASETSEKRRLPCPACAEQGNH